MQVNYSPIIIQNLRSNQELPKNTNTVFKGYSCNNERRFSFNELNPVNYYVNKLFKRSLIASSKRIQEIIPELSPVTKEVNIPNSYLWDINPNNRKKYVIVMHGTSQNITNLQSLYKGIIENTNYAVLAPEYQGFGKNPKSIVSEKTISSNMNEALKYLKDKNIDPQDITLIGHSFGGFAAAKLAQMNDNLERLILVSSINTLQHETVRISNVKKQRIPKFASFLFNNFKIFRKPLVSALQTEKNVAKTNIPVTIIHSKNDDLVPYTVAYDLINKCKKPDGVYLLKNGGHGMNTSKIDAITTVLSGKTPDNDIECLDVLV